MKYLLSLSFALLFSTAATAETRTVEQLVEEALSKNPEVAAYEADIESAKALHSVAGNLQNPTLNFELGRNKVASPGLITKGKAYTAGINQPIDWPGRLGLREAIANQNITLAELGLERFKFNLASQVRVLAQKIAAGQRVSQASAQVSTRYNDLKSTISQRRPAGIAPQLELDTIKAAAVITQLKVTETDIAMRSAMLELNRITGLEITAHTEVSETDFVLEELPPDAELFRMAAENNYDVRIKRSELEQQGFKVELAENERFPTFTVGPFISRENSSEEQTIVGLSVSLPFPVWDSGTAKVRSARAKHTQAEASLNLQQREVEKKLAEAALIFRTYQSQLKASHAAGFSGSASEAERHYQLGGVPIATYVTMQDKYLEAVAAVNSTKIKALEAGLLIEELTGAPGSVVNLGKQ